MRGLRRGSRGLERIWARAWVVGELERGAFAMLFQRQLDQPIDQRAAAAGRLPPRAWDTWLIEVKPGIVLTSLT